MKESLVTSARTLFIVESRFVRGVVLYFLAPMMKRLASALHAEVVPDRGLLEELEELAIEFKYLIKGVGGKKF
jgi:hypothetical protein